jgi:SnoaL-like protein
MTFRQTLDKHLQAIRGRDLRSFIETLPKDQLLQIMANGSIIRNVNEFVEGHRAWFEMPSWEIEFEPIDVYETADMGVAVLKLDYSDLKPSHDRFHEFSILTLIFARRDGRWVMVCDQNTPIKTSVAE